MAIRERRQRIAKRLEQPIAPRSLFDVSATMQGIPCST
jgi:hypothetical protein